MKIIAIFKKHWKIVLFVFIVPIFISQVIRIPLGHWTIAEEGDWVGFLGNYGGGILGGIIAFLVARDQFEKQSKQVRIKSLALELPVLTGVEIECDKILKQLINVEEYFGEISEDRDTYFTLFDALKWERWMRIDLIMDPILQEELIKHEEFLQRNIEVFEIDIHTLEHELEKKKSIGRKMSLLHKGYIELDRDISKLSLNIEAFKKDKIHYLDELLYCIEKTRKIKTKVKERKEKIHVVLKGNNFFDDTLLSNPDEFEVER